MKLKRRNVKSQLGIFTPTQDLDIEGSIEYSSFDFSLYSDEELKDMKPLYDISPTLKAKAYRLEIAERKLLTWQREN
jgi:hypothetical protein